MQAIFMKRPLALNCQTAEGRVLNSNLWFTSLAAHTIHMVCDLNNDVSTPDLINPDLNQDFISLMPANFHTSGYANKQTPKSPVTL